MENKDISRRETLGLAKFGLLLAAGLGVVEGSSAKTGELASTMEKGGEIGALYLKLFKYDGRNYSLLKTMEVPAVQSKLALSDNMTQLTIKFWRPATGAKGEGVFNTTSVKLNTP